MDNSQEPENAAPTFVPKYRAAWKNWLIVALILGGCGILTLFTTDNALQMVITWGGALVCLIGAGISALMRHG